MKSHTKAQILRAVSDIVRVNGYHSTGIEELVTAAGIPKGSFYYYFNSKEDFGLQLIDYYTDGIISWGEKLRSDNARPPLTKLRGFFDWSFAALENNDFKGGCPIGNLSMEMADVSESFRRKLDGAFAAIKKCIFAILEESRQRGEISDCLDVGQLCEFIVAGWQGALLQAKVMKSTAPRQVFEQMVFERLLKGESTGDSGKEAFQVER